MIYIPENFMVGFQRRVNNQGKLIDTDSDNEYVIGFATYKDQLNKIRCEKSWENWKHKENPVLNFQNDPIFGFKIVGTETRGSGGWNSTGRSVYDVVDPRGYVLQINSGNLIQILIQCDIKKGIIQNKCLWSWEGKNLILVPEETDLYREGIESFRLKNKKISIKDINLGDEIILQNGKKGMWLGSQYIVQQEYYKYYNYTHSKNEFIIGLPKRKFFFLFYDKKNNVKYLKQSSTFKIAEISQKTENPLSEQDVSDILIKHLEFIKDKQKRNKDKQVKYCDTTTLDGWKYDYGFNNYLDFSPKKQKDSFLLNKFFQNDKAISMWDEDMAKEHELDYKIQLREHRKW